MSLCTIVYGQAKTESLLIDKFLESVREQDVNKYIKNFVSFDSILQPMVANYQPQTLRDSARHTHLLQHQPILQQFDPQLTQHVAINFNNVLKKGIDSGIHWKSAILVRYELKKMLLPKQLIGFELIAPVRLEGFVFVQDLLTQRVYAMAVTNILKLKDEKWYGGEVVNILEAKTIDEYIAKSNWERKHGGKKALAAHVNKKKNTAEDDEEEEDKQNTPKEVIARKYFKGYFDSELEVELYIHYLKDDCPDVCSWQAIYRLQDFDNFLNLKVEKTKDGKWLFYEEPEVGVMELEVKEGGLVGTWMSLKDRTEYDVELYEKKEVIPAQLFQMDKILEDLNK
jgi:ribosomal protein L12E/L44/L45/RPP1/RPP2